MRSLLIGGTFDSAKISGSKVGEEGEAEGRRKKEEGRRKKEEGRRKKEEGRRKKEEGRRKEGEGQKDFNRDACPSRLVIIKVLLTR